MLFENYQRQMSSKPGDTRLVRSLRGLFLAGLVFFIAWLVYFSFETLTIPYQIEFREGSSMVLTQLLLEGENPFSAENQPYGMTNYGIVYSLLVLPFAALFGNTLLVHRAITLLFLTLCAVLVARSSFRQNQHAVFSVACGLFVAIALAGRGGLGAFPHVMGAFLFLAGILVPLERSFDRGSLMASAVLSLIALYTKPYFVLVFAIVGSYVFLFVSKKRALQAGLFFLLVFVLTFLLVRYACKYYYIDTFVSNFANSNKSPLWLQAQLINLTFEFFAGALIGIALLAAGAARPALRGVISLSDIWVLDRPIFSRPFNYFAYCFIVCALVFMSVLGTSRGNYMTYSYQLVVPPFFLWLFNRLVVQPRLALISLPLLLLNLGLITHILLSPAFLQQRDSPGWAQLHWYVSHSRQILNPPIIAAEMIELGMQPYDSGHMEFFYSIDPYPASFLLGPDYETVLERGRAYSSAQHIKIRQQEYDRVFMVRESTKMMPLTLIHRNYVMVDEIYIEMPQLYHKMIVEVWEPIP